MIAYIHVNRHLLEESWVESYSFDKIHNFNLNFLSQTFPKWSWKCFFFRPESEDGAYNECLSLLVLAFLTRFWNLDFVPNIDGNPYLQHPQTIPQNIFCFKKAETFSIISETLVVVSREQNRNSSLYETEWTYPANTSNWEHDTTSIDSSSWIENKTNHADLICIIWSLMPMAISLILLWTVLFDSETAARFFSELSPKTISTILRTRGLIIFSPVIYVFFCFATNLLARIF